MFETLTVKTCYVKISSIAGLFEKSDLSLTHQAFESWALASATRYLFGPPAPAPSLPPSLPPSLRQQRAQSGALREPDSAALRRTVWFCSAVGFDFLTVEVTQIEKKSDFSQHMYLASG